MPEEEGQVSLGTEAQETTAQPEGQPQETQPQQEGLADGFLKGIPEEHRPYVEPYLKKWDAGVTRRFQEIHSRFRPYQELGELEELRAARQLYDILNSEPQRLYQALAQQFGQTPGQQGLESQQVQQQPVPQQQYQRPPGMVEDDEYEQQIKRYLDPVTQQIQQQNQVLQTLAQVVIQQRDMEKQQQEDQELDQYMGLLKQEFGDFDEDYVLSKMLHGMDGEAAVKSWQQALQARINQANAPQQNLPPVLSGGGAVVNDQKQVTELGSRDVKGLVANLISQANQQ